MYKAETRNTDRPFPPFQRLPMQKTSLAKPTPIPESAYSLTFLFLRPCINNAGDVSCLSILVIFSFTASEDELFLP